MYSFLTIDNPINKWLLSMQKENFFEIYGKLKAVLKLKVTAYLY